MNNIKRIISLQLVAILTLLGTSVGIAQAHVLKQDNGMSAVLHIPPEDNPKAGQPTELDITFYNQQNTFSLNDCTCGVTVKSGNSVIQKATPKPYLSGATLDTKTTVTFPKVGIYNVIVSGSALDGKFQPFTLNYLERVATNANGSGATVGGDGGGSEAIIVGAAGLIILVMFAYSGISNGGRYKQKKVSKKSTNEPLKTLKTNNKSG